MTDDTETAWPEIWGDEEFILDMREKYGAKPFAGGETMTDHPKKEIMTHRDLDIKIVERPNDNIPRAPLEFPFTLAYPPESVPCPNCCAEVFVLAARLAKLDPVRHRAVYEVLEDVENIFGRDAAWKWGPELLRKALQRSHAERINLPLDDVSDEQTPRWCLVSVRDEAHPCIVCHRGTCYRIDTPIDNRTLQCELLLNEAPCCEKCFSEMERTVREAIQKAKNGAAVSG